MSRGAAAFAWLSGYGFGLPCVYGIWYLAENDEVWTFFGFPTYGKGVFEKAGVDSSVPLLGGFLAVCAAEVVAGHLLWQRRRSGRVLSWALLPGELAYWIGFSLPFGPVLGAARIGLVARSGRRPALDA